MNEQERMRRAVTSKIRTLEKRVVAQAVHFIPHYPRYHDGHFRISCWCGEDDFKSACLDTHELARMISWFNAHASCQPKQE